MAWHLLCYVLRQGFCVRYARLKKRVLAFLPETHINITDEYKFAKEFFETYVYSIEMNIFTLTKDLNR